MIDTVSFMTNLLHLYGQNRVLAYFRATGRVLTARISQTLADVIHGEINERKKLG